MRFRAHLFLGAPGFAWRRRLICLAEDGAGPGLLRLEQNAEDLGATVDYDRWQHDRTLGTC
jgi:hypothetical protein